VTDAPVAGALVVPPPRVQVQHAAGVTDRQSADPPGHGPGDDHFGGFVLGLADPPPVPRLHQALAAPVVPPAPRPFLPGLGRAAGSRASACFAVGQVHAVLGADRPPRHQQSLAVGPGHRVRVDDPQIHPRHPGRIRLLPGRVAGDRDLGGDIDPQPPRIVEQRHRSDLFWRVGQVPVQPHPQRRLSAGDRDLQPPALECDAVAAAAADRLPCGVWRRRTRRRSSGAAPTGHLRYLIPQMCPARTQPAPGTAPDSPPVAGPAGPAARRSALARTPTHHLPRPVAQAAAAAATASHAAPPGQCGAPPAATADHDVVACTQPTSRHRQNWPQTRPERISDLLPIRTTSRACTARSANRPRARPRRAEPVRLAVANPAGWREAAGSR